MNPDEQRSRTWQIGGFAGGGFAPNYSIDDQFASIKFSLDFSNAGMEFGRMVTANHGAGPFHGRGEAMIELLPFWMAEYPRQTITLHFAQAPLFPVTTTFGPYSRHGASVSPALFRWNFLKDDTSRVVPWIQLGGGLLWTNHKFPLGVGSTSVINFTPQVDIGSNIFVKKNQSLNFAVKVVHISSAGLGDNNPGVNATLQFTAGYSWWR